MQNIAADSLPIVMDTKCIHHVEFGVQNGLKHVKSFLRQYKFQLAGIRTTPAAKQWLLCTRAVRFLITELTKDISTTHRDPYIHSWSFSPKGDVPKHDSVFNVALRVKNIDGCVARLAKHNVQIVKPLQTISDRAGSVRVCTVKSCVGNVVHTLVDDSEYSGLFLPGFERIENNCDLILDDQGATESNARLSPSPSDLHHIDHVTFCTHCGSSANVINWYEKCFGMKRFFINRQVIWLFIKRRECEISSYHQSTVQSYNLQRDALQ